jgi:hypothetical protein
MNLVLEFCTIFNGLFLFLADDSKPTDEMERVFDEVSDTLPTKTHEWCKENWQDIELTNAQVDELVADAQEIIKDVIPKANIVFKYNGTDT